MKKVVGKPKRYESVTAFLNAVGNEELSELNRHLVEAPKARVNGRPVKIWKNEDEFTRACFDRIHGDLAERWPELLRLCYHVPNENSHRRPGVVGGILDIALQVPRHNFSSMHIELKCGANKPSRNQLDVIAALRQQGALVYVIWDSVDEVVNKVVEYMS